MLQKDYYAQQGIIIIVFMHGLGSTCRVNVVLKRLKDKCNSNSQQQRVIHT